jgi:hypothetical protein
MRKSAYCFVASVVVKRSGRVRNSTITATAPMETANLQLRAGNNPEHLYEICCSTYYDGAALFFRVGVERL